MLEDINSPRDLKRIPQEKLPLVAQEIRDYMINVVSKTGGHLAPSLGVVELTVALHYIFESPKDVIFWDVGHQSYAHKILTGRRENFSTLRQLGGLSGFPNRYESPYDPVTCGHSSTSISTALGLASGRDLTGKSHKIIVVIGDASLAGGMAFEALNHAGHLHKDLIVILNDNEMSISPPIGAMSRYLNRVIANPIYNRVRREVESLAKRIPVYGKSVYRAARRLEEGLKNLLVPGILFEELGFRYFGPIDGHDINLIISTLRNISRLGEPVLVHALTKKGKGYRFAESYPEKFHGTAPFDVETGKIHSQAWAKAKGSGRTPGPKYEIKVTDYEETFTQAFSRKMVELGQRNPKVAAVTAAMPEGTGLDKFAREFPERFFDVGIAEQHATGFAAGLAQAGLKPVVAIYSTFLQRAYDQIIHDVCLQKLPVVLAIDRAGLVGEDGPTHHGPFDLAYLGSVPNLVIMAPKDQLELGAMLEFAIDYNGPIAIRYPRGSLISKYRLPIAHRQSPIALAKSEVLRTGQDLTIVALGSMVYPSMEASDVLQRQGVQAAVINARFAKPLDSALFKKFALKSNRFLLVEEGTLQGGFGSMLLEFFESQRIGPLSVKRIALPDRFIEHGLREQLLKKCGLWSSSIAKAALKLKGPKSLPERSIKPRFSVEDRDIV